MFKVSAVPPRRSAVLAVFRSPTAINDGTTAEPRRSWRCHCVYAVQVPQWHRASGVTGLVLRNMFKVVAVPPRRSAVLTVFCGATTINDGTTAEPRRCHCCLCRTTTAVVLRLRCDGVLHGSGQGSSDLSRATSMNLLQAERLGYAS